MEGHGPAAPWVGMDDQGYAAAEEEDGLKLPRRQHSRLRASPHVGPAQECMPFRLRGVWLVYQPAWFSLLFTFVRSAGRAERCRDKPKQDPGPALAARALPSAAHVPDPATIHHHHAHAHAQASHSPIPTYTPPLAPSLPLIPSHSSLPPFFLPPSFLPPSTSLPPPTLLPPPHPRPFLGPKTRSRIRLLGDNAASMAELMDPAYMPAGDMPGGTGADCGREWFARELAREAAERGKAGEGQEGKEGEEGKEEVGEEEGEGHAEGKGKEDG